MTISRSFHVAVNGIILFLLMAKELFSMGSLKKDFQEILGWIPLEAETESNISHKVYLGGGLRKPKRVLGMSLVMGNWGPVPLGI